MKGQQISLIEHHEASVETSADGYVHVAVEAEFGLIPDSPTYIEAQLLSLKEGIAISVSEPTSVEVAFENPRIYVSDSFHSGADQIPDSYAINYRVFTPTSEPIEIETPIPPEIARQSGSYLIHTPKKGFISNEKWVSGAVSVDSIVVKNVAGEDDEVFVNVSSKKPLETAFVITCKSSSNSDHTIFQAFNKPQMTSGHLRLHLSGDLKVVVAGFSGSRWNATEVAQFTDYKEAEEYQEEEGHGDFSVEEPLLSDYDSVTESAFNWYVNMIRKFDDYDLALEKVVEELDRAVVDAGIETELGWYAEISERDFQGIIKALLGHYRRHYDEDHERAHYLGPLHTWLVGVLYERNSQIGEDHPDFLEYVNNGFLSEEGCSSGTSCSLYITGNGFDFQASRLDENDANEMKKFHEEHGEELFLGHRLTETSCTGSILCDDHYGPDPLDCSYSWEETGDAVEISTDRFVRIEYFDDFDNAPQTKNLIHFFGVAEGKVFGRVEIPVSDPSEFEEDKLEIQYFEFSLDGWPEKYGRAITSIIYDGRELDLEWEDNGQDVTTYLIGYEFDDEDEFVDYIVIHQSENGSNSEIDWTKLDAIFQAEK